MGALPKSVAQKSTLVCERARSAMNQEKLEDGIVIESEPESTTELPLDLLK